MNNFKFLFVFDLSSIIVYDVKVCGVVACVYSIISLVECLTASPDPLTVKDTRKQTPLSRSIR